MIDTGTNEGNYQVDVACLVLLIPDCSPSAVWPREVSALVWIFTTTNSSLAHTDDLRVLICRTVAMQQLTPMPYFCMRKKR